MKTLLIIYLTGVILMLTLVVISNLKSNAKQWRAKAILKALLCCLGSWAMIFVLAYQEIK